MTLPAVRVTLPVLPIASTFAPVTVMSPPFIVSTPLTVRLPPVRFNVRPAATVTLLAVNVPLGIAGWFVTPAAGKLTSFVEDGTAFVAQFAAAFQSVLVEPFQTAVLLTTCGLPVRDPLLVSRLPLPLYVAVIVWLAVVRLLIAHWA